jgi:hypothetical protein
MPWYGFIHPLLAVGTLALGLVVGQTSLSRMTDWDFPLRKQRTRSIYFFLLTVLNFVLGMVVMTALRGGGYKTRLTGHMVLAIGIMVLAMLAAIVTFTRGRNNEVSGAMRLHPLFIIGALALIFTNGFLTILALL